MSKKQQETKEGADDSTIALRGHSYSYGTKDQVAKYLATTRVIAEHAATTFEHGKDLWTLIETGTEPTFKKPPDVKDTASWSEKEEYKMLLREYLDN